MAARARRVAAESPPWVRHWRSCKRTRRRKTRESELGGAAPKVCSQTRRKLAKSKPSKTTFRPTPVSCGITERSLFCSIKSSLMRDFRVRSSLPVARPAADLSQPWAPPVGLLSLVTRSPGVGSQPCGARNTLDSARIPSASKLLICGLFQKGRVLAQDGIRAFGLRSYFRTRRVPTVSECSNQGREFCEDRVHHSESRHRNPEAGHGDMIYSDKRSQ